MDVAGALSSGAIAADDLAARPLGQRHGRALRGQLGDVSGRVLLRQGSIGEVSRLGRIGFTAELRGLAHALDQETGRTYQRQCDVKQLGDARCGFNSGTPGYSATGTVTAADDDRVIHVSGLCAFAAGWFSFGTLAWSSGLNAGVFAEVRAHGLSGGTASLTLWRRAPLPVAAGDTFSILAGCDRTFATCRDKFGNTANFRGFPHIPGNDFALGVARTSEENDGGSFFND